MEDEREIWTGRTRTVLETGGWWEVLPEDYDHFERHARAYVASDKVDPEAKERVRAVWLERLYRPAWRKFEEVRGGLPKRPTKLPPARAVKLPGQATIPDEDPF